VGLELRHLRCFVAVADHGQMLAAADALHLAQPAVSQTIGQLEREVGVALFQRHPRGVALTRAGEDLLPKARAALNSSAEAFQTARAHGREQRSQLLVGFLPPLTQIATEILAAYSRAQPSINVKIKQFDFGAHMEAVRRRAVDIAFVWAAFEERDVVLHVMAEEPRVVCLSADHPLAGAAQLRFEQIEDEPVPGIPAGFRTEIADFLHLSARRRRPARHADFVPRSIDETVWLLASGRAICIGPASLAEVLTRPGIVNVPLVDVEPVKIAVARHENDSRPAVRAFVRVAHGHYHKARADACCQSDQLSGLSASGGA
jgi:DNA-binding transcriptional LysR family regulator